MMRGRAFVVSAMISCACFEARAGDGPNQNTRIALETGRDFQETRLFSSATGDVRGDGETMLAVGGYTGSNARRIAEVSLYSRAKDSTWNLEARAQWREGTRASVRNVAVGDLDGDHRAEIIALGEIGEDLASTEAKLSIFALANNVLTEKASVHWKRDASSRGYGLAIGDLDRDGRLEIVSGGFGSDG